MTGGLIQLVVTGVQDAPLIANPEITFYKKMYKQHTNFSINEIEKYIDKKNFDSEGIIKIENNGDLLYNQYFKIEIPFFNIIQKYNKIINKDIYNINQLETIYYNTKCLVIYNNTNKEWYIIPEYLFKLYNFDNINSKIETKLLIDKLLPEYIKENNIGQYINFYYIKDNDILPLLSYIKIKINIWEEFILSLSLNNNINYLNKIYTLKTINNDKYKEIKNYLFNLYYKTNNLVRFQEDFNLIYNNKTELERYNEYINFYDLTIEKPIENYDIDKTFMYCKLNFYNFDNYKNNILEYNSLIILLLFKMLYLSNDVIFTFWKKYNTLNNNNIDYNTIINDYCIQNEWNDKLKQYIINILNINFNNNIFNNNIFETFLKLYYSTKSDILNLFIKLNLNNPIKLYINLKIILNRFYKLPNKQLNYNNYYFSTAYSSNVISSYEQDNYNFLNNNEEINYPKLIKYTNKLSKIDTNNLMPIDLQNIYSVIANELINIEINSFNLSESLISFLILWRNTVNCRLYKKYLETIHLIKKNINLYGFDNERKLTFYLSITPGNFYLVSDFKKSFYEMFFKNSWYGSINIGNNNFLKFKESIHDINKIVINNNILNKDFHKLTIQNIYLINEFIYDKNNNKILIKYDNYYDNNSKIIITDNNNNIINYNSIYYENYEKKLYLCFNNISSDIFKINYTIINNIYKLNNPLKLTVNYTSYLPLILFYNNNLNYSNIIINKYFLLTKKYNNEIDINKIDNNNIIIDNDFYNLTVNNIKILTIEYNYNNIIKPFNSFSLNVINIINQYNLLYIEKGSYLYAISFISINNEESDLSDFKEINLLDNQFVNIENIPISTNLNIIKRKIYRTKKNENIFYLLTIINDNITQNFIDNISDINLGKDTINTNIINNVNKNNNKIVKIPILINNNNNNYTILSNNNEIYNLPKTFTNISSIYIEIINKYYYFIDNFIFINNKIKLLNTNDFTDEYLYYLINYNNYKDNIKLIPTKLNIVYNNDILLGNLVNKNSHIYKFTLYNSNTLDETIFSNDFVINLLNNNKVLINLPNLNIIDNSKYNKINIYRTKENDSITNYIVNTIDINNTYYEDILSDNLLINKRFVPYLNENINSKNDVPGLIPTGKYYYIFNYYNINKLVPPVYSNPREENLVVDCNLTFYNFPLNSSNTEYSKYTNIKIYRTHKNNPTKYYLLDILDINITTYTDNKKDDNLNIILDDSINNINITIEEDIENNTNPYLNRTITDNNNIIYKYKLSFYNSVTNIESLPTISYNIELTNEITNTNKILINNFPNILNTNYNSIKLYRTKKNNNIYYLINTFINTNIINYYDRLTDSDINNNLPLSDELYFYITKIELYNPNINYKILKIPINNFVPNLHSLISHSTDYKFINDKNISDFSDFIFNKPFLLLENNSNDSLLNNIYNIKKNFNVYYLYFYNINFKINTTSIIKLNDEISEYLLPISTQQFFIKDSQYYKLDLLNNKILLEVNKNITQLTFNPSFDEFNLYNLFSRNIYIDNIVNNFIDDMIYQIEYIINSNIDYINIINLLENINNKYINIFTELLNNINNFGITTQKILNNIDKNNIFDFLNNGNIPIYNYNNNDYYNISHYTFNLSDENQNLNIKNSITNINSIFILTNIYNEYNANSKISQYLIEYLNNISLYYKNQKKYINNNSDYINITEPNNYIEKYLSFNEINLEIKNNFYDYTSDIIINLLFPNIDTNCYSIIINHNIFNNVNILNNNQIFINNKIQPIIENNINNINIKDTNNYIFNNNKFNYIGLLNINIENNIVFQNILLGDLKNTYIKLDNNKIYKINSNITNNNVTNYIEGNVNNMLVYSPIHIIFLNEYTTPYVFTRISNIYLYKIIIEFENNISNIEVITPDIDIEYKVINSKIYINNEIYDCKINDNIIYLYTEKIINFNSFYIIYQKIYNNSTSWNISNKIIKYNIDFINKVNLYINIFDYNLLDIFNYSLYNYTFYISSYDIISFNNKFYLFIDNIFNNNIILNKYTFLQNVVYNPNFPPVIIKNSQLFYYYENYDFTKILYNFPQNFFILLIDKYYNNFILPINTIKQYQIPLGIYHTWLLPSDHLELIEINLVYPIFIDNYIVIINNNKLLEYSYYLIEYNNKKTIYYYKTGPIIYIHYTFHINYYIDNAFNITKIYLINNNLFNTNAKQFIDNKYKVFCYENIIDKKLLLSTLDNLPKFYNINELYYNSKFLLNYYNIKYFVNNNIELSGINEEIIYIFIKSNLYNINIIYPIIFTSNYNNNNIFIKYNDIYLKSLIVLKIDSISINLNIAHIESNDIFKSLSNLIYIDNQNNIILNSINIQEKIYLLKIFNNTKNNILYIWLVFTNNNNIYDIYLNLFNNYYEPFNQTFISFTNQYTFLASNPDIFEFYNDKLYIKNTLLNTFISYKYYNNIRNNEINENITIKQLNFNGINNIKPNINILNDTTINTKNIIYFILLFNNSIDIIYNNTIKSINDIIKENVIIYYSLCYPYFIYNNIILNNIFDNLYEIVKYDYLFLENNEIIMINDNYFIIKGINIYTNNYELELIKSGEKLNNNYNGYYSLGSYLKNNNDISNLNMSNIMKYYTNINIKKGTLYKKDNEFIITLNDININNCFIFEYNSFTIKLYHNNSKLFLFDNFTKLKIFDKIIYNNNIYEIINIRDNEIFLNESLNIISNNLFIDVIIPYLPFEIIYVNKYTINNYINDILLINHPTISNKFIIYDILLLTENFKFLYLLKNNITPYFINSMIVPINYYYLNFNNKHPIEILGNYNIITNTIKITNHYKNFKTFDFYYLQPIKINNIINYITNIILDNSNNYILYLLNTINIDNINNIYKFNLILPKNNNSIIYLYDDDEFNENNIINYIKSNYIIHDNQITKFMINNNINILSKKFTQKTYWDINNFKINDTYYILFDLPNDFIFKNDNKYLYYINNFYIDNNNFLPLSNTFSFNIIYLFTTIILFNNNNEKWIISNYTLNNLTLIFKLPNNFIFNNQYKYYINNYEINNLLFISPDQIITINLVYNISNYKLNNNILSFNIKDKPNNIKIHDKYIINDTININIYNLFSNIIIKSDINEYIINNFDINNNIITFNLPNNFVYNEDIIYTINNYIINNKDFINPYNLININLYQLINKITFIQYYNETNNIISKYYDNEIKLNIICSPSFNNKYNYYTFYKFNYNYQLNTIEYNNKNSNIDILSYYLLEDQLIFVEENYLITYNYKFSLFNSNTNDESILSNIYSISLIKFSNIQINFSNFSNVNNYYNKIKIYRNKINDENFYELTILDININNFNDNIIDKYLINKYNYLILNLFITNVSGNIDYGIYYYIFKYFNSNNYIYSQPILVNIESNSQIIFNNLLNNDYTNISIYRTKKNSNNYYLIDTINIINEYSDNKNDNILIEQLNNPFDNFNINFNSYFKNNHYNIIHFYNNVTINIYNKNINNIDTIINSYHLLLEYTNENNIIIHLCKIINYNKIKVYSNININNIFYLDKIIPIKINHNFDFIYLDFNIYETKNLLNIDYTNIKIINKYEISITSNFILLNNNLYKQEIIFKSNFNNYFDKIYLDITNLSKFNVLIFENNKYYIISKNYILSDTIYIYTINDNYILNTINNYTIKTDLHISDDNINYIINYDNNKNEYIKFNLLLLRFNDKNIFKYTYKLNDNTQNINLTLDINYYKFNSIYESAYNININEYYVLLNNIIYNLELKTNYETTDIFIQKKNKYNYYFDNINLYNNIKKFRLNFIYNNKINAENLYNFIKPWNNWSIINSVQKVNSLISFVNNCALKWVNNNIIFIYNNDYKYITNNELIILKQFLININTNEIRKNNYYQLINIQNILFNNISTWLLNPFFFFNVKDNINNFLLFHGFYTAYFNGEHIIFSNDLNPEYITIDNNKEVAYYITNEFTFNNIDNIVYRSNENLNNINNEINNWINNNKTSIYGVNINKLLRYLYYLGNEFINLYNEL